jgi:hypothetical protein
MFVFTTGGDVCELKVNDSIKFLSINQTWTNGCDTYSCKSTSDNDVIVEKNPVECNLTCGANEILKSIPGECCGKCVDAFCIDANKKRFKIGDVWKSDDNCVINECGSDLEVTSYNKKCPKVKNCPNDAIEVRDCCQFCNYRRESERLLLE